MLCEKCKKADATTHIRSVVNGNVIEKHLCSSCAANEGFADANGSSLSQILSSMLDASSTNKLKSTSCSCCGSTFEDISQGGKCGCPECYSLFYQQFLPFIQNVQGSTAYVGKMPVKTNDEDKTDDTKQNELDRLNELLRQLIKEEKYEQAAVVRDQIIELKEGAI